MLCLCSRQEAFSKRVWSVAQAAAAGSCSGSLGELTTSLLIQEPCLAGDYSVDIAAYVA